MAKPNYSFEKRQRELAKKKKKEEKKAARKDGGGADENPNDAAMDLVRDAPLPAEVESDPPDAGTPPAQP